MVTSQEKPMSDRENWKKEFERDRLRVFLDAYSLATGETFSEVAGCETPDFVALDDDGNSVGIETTALKFHPEHMLWRRIIDREEWADHNKAHWRLLEVWHKKQLTLGKGVWPRCARRILVIELMDCPLADLMPNLITERPTGNDFDEIWLVDHTMVDVYGGGDIFPLIHGSLEGLFDVASRDRKPYG